MLFDAETIAKNIGGNASALLSLRELRHPIHPSVHAEHRSAEPAST